MKRMMLLFIIGLLLTSCTLLKPKKQEADILGTDGLVMTLPQIPKELYVGQGLDIPIALENVGAHKVENAVLVIAGYNRDFVHFRTLPKKEGINLEGRSQFVPVGEKTIEVFTISSIELPQDKERKEIFEAIACYQYRTEASPVVCINPQLAFGSQAVKQGCDFVDAQISSNQGAPVAVTKVETWYYSNQQEIEFRVHVKDVSTKGGVVFDRLAYAKRCLSAETLKPEDFNSIGVEAFLGPDRISCYLPSGQETNKFTIALEGYSIACKAQINPDQPAYTTPLTLRMTYGYVTLDIFSITLKNQQFRG